MKHLPLTTRLALGFLLVAALPLAILAWFYLHTFEETLSQTVLQNISSIADKKADQINTFINERLDDVQTLSRSAQVRQTMEAIEQERRRGAHLSPTQEAAYRNQFNTLIRSSVYHDLLLIAPNGDVVFSLRQEADLDTSLTTGPYKDTGLAVGFRQAMASLYTDLTTFEAYGPSNGKTAAFLVAPLLEEGRPAGALALQLNLDTITPVLADRTGLGSTGETILAEPSGDSLRLPLSIRHDQPASLAIQMPMAQASQPMRLALAGDYGSGLTRDSAGKAIAAAWRYLPALGWGMVVKIDQTEALAPVIHARQTTWLALILFLVLSGTSALVIGWRFFHSERIIARQEARYRGMFDHMNEGVSLFRLTKDQRDFTIIDFNRAAETITGLRRDEVKGKRLTKVFPGVIDSGFLETLKKAEKTGQMQSLPQTHYQDEHLELWVENEVVRLPGGDVLSVFRDVTAKRDAETALHLYASVFAHSSEAIIITDADNRIVAANPAFTALTGYSQEDVLGQGPSLLASGETSAEVYQDMWTSLNERGFWHGELWDRNKNGEMSPCWASISVIRNLEGEITHHIANFTDITERKASEERIAHMAHHDALTGLFNRYNLESRLAQALLDSRREGRYLAILFIDLDRFKIINDTLGHHIGDLLLVEISHRLQHAVRDSDIVARPGGDEFVVVLTGLREKNDADEIAQNILRTLSEPIQAEAHILHSTPSIGISQFPEDGEDVETLLKHADAAMYHAKEQGRNNIQRFTPDLDAASGERLALERDLREAIKQNQFSLHYQPQVCNDDSRLVGFEALIRWQHPVKGMIMPQQFIPIAEETGLITQIGSWVLDEACRQLVAWRRNDARFALVRMAVNLSAQQLRSHTLVEEVRQALIRHQLRDNDLELEITETVAMHNPAQAITQLQALRQLGVCLAIDDFGTGYSSLAYLKRLPIQTLKLDREFVRDIEDDSNDAAISAATLALAHSLGLKVVAEGVTTDAQRYFLRIHRCDYLQGFGIAPPMQGEDVPDWLTNYQAAILHTHRSSRTAHHHGKSTPDN